jgi:hypothetical protein
VRARVLLSFPSALKLLMCEFGKWDGWMGFTGPGGALMAVEFLASFDVAFCRLAPAVPTDLSRYRWHRAACCALALRLLLHACENCPPFSPGLLVYADQGR